MTSAPRDVQARIGPPIGRALTVAAATWTSASAGKSTAARTVGLAAREDGDQRRHRRRHDRGREHALGDDGGRELVRAQMTATSRAREEREQRPELDRQRARLADGDGGCRGRARRR